MRPMWPMRSGASTREMAPKQTDERDIRALNAGSVAVPAVVALARASQRST
jgi:hypothetical protein